MAIVAAEWVASVYLAGVDDVNESGMKTSQHLIDFIYLCNA